ncbi:MAG TPA: PAS domain S-box protein [Lentimicrobium sp.]|nr:PAS domain S-box protein [Lentimicrobium sp.]
MSTTKRKTEIDLSAQEGNYKHMFMNNPAPMWIFDQETLDFLEVNDAALKQYGYTREEFLSLNARDLRPVEEISALESDVINMKGAANFAGDWIHKKKNGEIVIANIVSHPIVFKGRQARHVTAINVTEQRNMEKAIKSNEERFRSIVEGAPEPIFIQVDKKFVYVNSTAVRLFNVRNADEIIGRNIIDFVHPSYHSIVEKRIDRINQKRLPVQEILELRFLTIDGKDLWVETAGQPIEYEGKPAGLVFVRDITNRKKTAEVLSYNEYLLKEMGRIAKIGGWEFDPVTGKGTWTEEVARIHGMSPDEETDANKGISFYKDASKVIIESAIKEALEKKIPYDLELEMELQDGTHKWVHTFGHPVVVDGKVIKLRGSFQDITQRKLAEKALIESEHKYKAFFENSLDAMILSMPTGEIIEVNQATCQLLGYTDAELRKLTRNEIVDTNDENLLPFLKKREATGIAVGELRFVKKDGTLVDTEISSAIFMDAHDQPKTSMIIRDISTRKRNEQRINQLNSELEQKIEERTAQLKAVNKDLEAFAYSVSHDLRAPLRSINGLTQILQDNYSMNLDLEGQRLTERIRYNATKMTTLIEDLLSFSKASTSEIRKSKVDMNKLVKIVISEIGDKESIDRIEFIIDNLPGTEGDPASLRQVWINLLSNAVKFSSRKEKPVIEISGIHKGNKNFYKIKDNGAGFDMKYSDKIFAAFQRLHSDQEFQGTGAGLAIVQRILLKHGGNIWAEGEEGKGATFTFCLPS